MTTPAPAPDLAKAVASARRYAALTFLLVTVAAAILLIDRGIKNDIIVQARRIDGMLRHFVAMQQPLPGVEHVIDPSLNGTVTDDAR